MKRKTINKKRGIWLSGIFILFALVLLTACAAEINTDTVSTKEIIEIEEATTPKAQPSIQNTQERPVNQSSNTDESGRETVTISQQPEGEVQVHFIDVGQGDSILIITPDNNILIDGGNRGRIALEYVMSRGIDELEIVIGTHPHADHIGGLIDVIREMTVKEVIDPGVIHTTKTFEEYLTLIDEKDITFTEGRAGMRRDLGDGVIFEILHPQNPSSQHLNDASVVVRITYGDISFLFAGDAEEASELEMIQRSHDLKSTVLKTGHHGSSTSTSRSFLDAVNPEIAVIMCAEGNTYGHPHAQTLQRLIDSGIDVYRTDISGNIVITTDGSTYRVSADKMPDETTVLSEDKLLVVSYTGSVAAGEDASITIKGKPNTEYTILVEYKSGASTAKGLEKKISDANGYASWTWMVGTRTTKGSWPISVSGDGETIKVYFEVK